MSKDMERFIVEREVPKMSDEELRAAGQKALEVSDEMDGVNWVRSYVSESGKVYCEMEATDESAIRAHAQKAGLPVDGIASASDGVDDSIKAISNQLSPDMFR